MEWLGITFACSDLNTGARAKLRPSSSVSKIVISTSATAHYAPTFESRDTKKHHSATASGGLGPIGHRVTVDHCMLGKGL